ncbi:hypothetical protein E8E11_003151 [Didymella keratinophila]|nr:hypothetical protein E8E11_003151 [Didymella keratinophila]
MSNPQQDSTVNSKPRPSQEEEYARTIHSLQNDFLKVHIASHTHLRRAAVAAPSMFDTSKRVIKTDTAEQLFSYYKSWLHIYTSLVSGL